MVVVRLPRTRISFVEGDDGFLAAPVEQERAKIRRRRRLAERVGAWAREKLSSATWIKTVRRGRRTTTMPVGLGRPTRMAPCCTPPLGTSRVGVSWAREYAVFLTIESAWLRQQRTATRAGAARAWFPSHQPCTAPESTVQSGKAQPV